jgi:hypothetical protein
LNRDDSLEETKGLDRNELLDNDVLKTIITPQIAERELSVKLDVGNAQFLFTGASPKREEVWNFSLYF